MNLPIRSFALVGLFALPLSETFAQSQGEMNSQAFAAYEKADTRLNHIYQRLLATLDAEGKKKLQAAQRAWIVFRDAEATFQADGYRGGTMAPLEYAATRTELTEERIKSFQKQLLPGSK